MVSQDVVEEEIFAVLQRSKHGRVWHDTEFLEYEELEGGVSVTTRNLRSGEQRKWTADYLVGADGAGSSVRRLAGIEMRGPSTLAVMANEYWTADLSALPRDQRDRCLPDHAEAAGRGDLDRAQHERPRPLAERRPGGHRAGRTRGPPHRPGGGGTRAAADRHSRTST